MSELLTVEEVANKLKVCKETVYRLLRAGKIVAFKIGHIWRIDENDVNDYFQSRKNIKSYKGKSRKTASLVHAEPSK